MNLDRMYDSMEPLFPSQEMDDIHKIFSDEILAVRALMDFRLTGGIVTLDSTDIDESNADALITVIEGNLGKVTEPLRAKLQKCIDCLRETFEIDKQLKSESPYITVADLQQFAREQADSGRYTIAIRTLEIAQSIADITPNDAPLVHVPDDDGCALDDARD